MSSTLLTSSIEGVGLQAAEPQNMGVACDFLAQGSKCLRVMRVNKSISTELHERCSVEAPDRQMRRVPWKCPARRLVFLGMCTFRTSPTFS